MLIQNLVTLNIASLKFPSLLHNLTSWIFSPPWQYGRQKSLNSTVFISPRYHNPAGFRRQTYVHHFKNTDTFYNHTPFNPLLSDRRRCPPSKIPPPNWEIVFHILHFLFYNSSETSLVWIIISRNYCVKWCEKSKILTTFVFERTLQKLTAINLWIWKICMWFLLDIQIRSKLHINLWISSCIERDPVGSDHGSKQLVLKSRAKKMSNKKN